MQEIDVAKVKLPSGSVKLHENLAGGWR